MKRQRLLFIISAVASATLWAYACGDGTTTTEPPAPDPLLPTTVTVSPATATVVEGDTLRLTATATNVYGQAVTGVEFVWASGDTAVAVVDSTGLVTGVGAGEVQVTATAAGLTGRAELAVVAPLPTTVTVTPDTVVLTAVGQTAQLTAEVRDQAGRAMDGVPVAWLSAETTVAAVDASGLVTAVGGGAVTVTVRAGEASGDALVTVAINPDRAALVALYNATGGPNWVNNENWLTDAPLGEWYGVETDADGRVVRVLLGRQRLTGPIPPELGKLAELEWLNLFENTLTGPIPPELGNLAELSRLDLWYNDLTGPIPQSFLQLGHLWIFFVVNGQDVCVPGVSAFIAWLEGIENRDTEAGSFCNAADVAALRALFEGTDGAGWTESDGWLGDDAVEEWYGVTADSLGHVTELALEGNGLTGRLPATLGDMPRMTVLRISDNALSGRLPRSLTDLSLVEFRYSETELCAPAGVTFQDWLNAITSLEGTGVNCDPPSSDRDILEIFYDASGGPNWTNKDNWLTDAPLKDWYGVEVDGEGRVSELVIYDNNLTGRIPPELGNLAELVRLDLGTYLVLGRAPNKLTGPIPPELGNIPDLVGLDLQGNSFTGRIPPELGNIARLYSLSLADNKLTGRIPPELGNIANLRGLFLSSNDLSGSVPPELGALTRLGRLTLARNPGLTGALPQSLTGSINWKSCSRAGRNCVRPGMPTSRTGWTEWTSAGSHCVWKGRLRRRTSPRRSSRGSFRFRW